jgi:predicted AlkP superfamily pyrophosphatase or phosphodiesterase
VKRVCIINVVGLTPNLMCAAPNIQRLEKRRNFGSRSWLSPLPAVTSTCQATLLTGLAPRDHGIVANGWYFRDTQEIRFWQQANSLIQGRPFYDGILTAKMFWWFNQGSSAKYTATPKPHYGCDGSKVFDILDFTGCDLVERLGPFPFFSFWGPNAGLPSSRWIADASAIVIKEKQPTLTLVYLPHLDYDFQRYHHQDPQRVAEVDECVAKVIDAAESIDAIPIIISEYGLHPVTQPVHINRFLREQGWLKVRRGPFGEMLMPGESEAFAVSDHQLAHVYVKNPNNIETIRLKLQQVPGIDRVVNPEMLELDHPRSGELIALAKPEAWFTYYYWLDNSAAPDFATTVDIHRKPGYDPCELFLTSRFKAMRRVAQKKLGFRYKLDVIPLDANLVSGSHGLQPIDPNDGPIIIGPGALPANMQRFGDYVRECLENTGDAAH